MTEFSANLGFLWTEFPLPEAIRAAKAAGFAAVEFHWPYSFALSDVNAALNETGMPVLSLNTVPGDAAAGEFGLCALPARTEEARASIDEAISYGSRIGAGAVHVMAGNADGQSAESVFVENLIYACAMAAQFEMTILIEPLNRYDVPDYFLQNTAQAKNIITRVNQPNLRLLFDCYHVARSEGDIIPRMIALHEIIGHIQFASVPDRGRPDTGEVNYSEVFDAISAMSWSTPLGAEYKPNGATEPTLGWLKKYR